MCVCVMYRQLFVWPTCPLPSNEGVWLCYMMIFWESQHIWLCVIWLVVGELTTFSHVVSSWTSLVICCSCCFVCQSCRSCSSVCSLSHSGQQSVLCDWSTFVYSPYSPKNPCAPALFESNEFYLFKCQLLPVLLPVGSPVKSSVEVTF